MAYFIKLVLLMSMGLGAMYMIHLLAQDFNRIRQPTSVAVRALTSASANIGIGLTRGKRDSNYNSMQNLTANQDVADWNRILVCDPLECLQSLICQLISGADGASTQEAIQLLGYMESTVQAAPMQIKRAFSRGIAVRGNSERCFDLYPFCFYSAKVMLRLLNWFSNIYQEGN